MCLSIPAQLVSIDESSSVESIYRNGKVSFGGILKTVHLAYVPEARVGDWVLVHVGFALSVIDEEQARLTFEALRGLEEANS